MVTRGNVAIYCYNALTAKTWDVTESTDGKLTSSAFNTDTILAKYFSDFTNEAGKMKLLEDVKVEATGATTAKYGENQIVLTNDKNNIASFIDAEGEPRKGKEEVTYDASYVTGTGEEAYTTEMVVAYVPAEVANITNLAGKKVDVIFGKDNEIAYLEVVSDVVENSFVTAWNVETAEEDYTIEIDGEEYDLAYDSKAETPASTVSVSVFGKYIGTGVSQISTLFGEGKLNCLDSKGNLTRKIVADIELNPNDEISAINFKFSATYANAASNPDVTVVEYIVEDVTAKKIVTATGDLTIKTLEKEEPRVVKNDKVATLDDIAAGDVLTVVVVDGNKVIYAVSNTVEGTLVDYVKKSNALEIDGEEYNVVVAPVYNVEGETDNFTSLDMGDVLTTFEDEDVVAYLNMFGEVVALVGESEATGTVLGVITANDGLIKDRSAKVYYLDVEILSADGTKAFYSIYNKNSKQSMTSDDVTTYAAGKAVVFSADADGIIKSDDIEVVTAKNYTLDGSTVTATYVTSSNTPTADIKNERLTVDTDDEYKYTYSTVIMNSYETKKELISWEAFTKDGEAGDLTTQSFLMFTRGTKLVYVVASVSEYGVSEAEYGFITAFGSRLDENDDRVRTVTVLTEDGEETYDCTSDLREFYVVGDLVEFTTTDDTITEVYDDEDAPTAITSPAFVAYYDLVEALADLTDEDILGSGEGKIDVTAYVNAKLDVLVSANHALDFFKVDSVEGDTLEFKYRNGADYAYEIVDLDEDCVVYDLVNGEVSEVSAGDYVLYLDLDTEADKLMDIVIIVK